jgi:hypothetical protein
MLAMYFEYRFVLRVLPPNYSTGYVKAYSYFICSAKIWKAQAFFMTLEHNTVCP